jgi:hypothetical protein
MVSKDPSTKKKATAKLTIPISRIEGGAYVEEELTLVTTSGPSSHWHDGPEIYACPECGTQAIESPLGPELNCRDGHTFYFASARKKYRAGCCICEETGAHPGTHGYMAEGEFVAFD